MRVLVTGGAGFIGANLVRRMRASAVTELVVLDDCSTGTTDNLAGLDDVELLVGSILDEDLLRRAVAGCDAVVHLAARPSVPRSIADPVASHDVNATGTLRVLEAARHADVGHVVVASSSSVYGANPVLPKHEDLATVPLSPYAASKLAAEGYALAYGTSFGLGVLALRFFNVYGPLQRSDSAYAAVIPTFVRAALDGCPLPVNGDGKQTRDFTFVASVTDVITRAVEGRLSSTRPLNVAFGSRSSLLDVVTELGEIVGRELDVDWRPPRQGDVRDSQADGGALRELVPEATPVPLAEGLRETVGWMRATTVGRDP